MRRLLLPAVLVLANPWSPAFATVPVPDPANCSIPDNIIVVGHDGASADPYGTINVVVRDQLRRALPNSMVTVSFAGCPYIGICPTQADPRIVIEDCAGVSVGALTNLTGTATLSIVGAASPALCPSDPPLCAAIYADGVFLGNASVAAFDLDGLPGLGGGDLAAWLDGFMCGSGSPRFDYDGFGVDGGDLSPWLAAFFSARSALGCSTAPCK